MADNLMNFTMKRIEELPPAPAGSRYERQDTGMPGLTVRVTDKGVKTFCIRKRVNGEEVRFTIGRFPAVSLDEARKEARELMSKMERGENPAALKRAKRAEPTFGELFEGYVGTPGKRKDSTVRNYRQAFGAYLEPWAKAKASSITRSDVRALHARITKGGAPYAANRTVALLRAIFNHAAKAELIKGNNPAEGIELNKEESREVRLLPSQLGAFLAAVESYPDTDLRDFFSLCLLSGQRKANVLSMRWEDVHLGDRLWIIPETKNGKPQYVPLMDEELAILERRKDAARSPWVFPSHGKSGHLVEPKAAWRAILKTAGIPHGALRIHDLRRTLGSLMGDAGVSLPTIGKTLGHLSQLTTGIYARLSLDPVRAAKMQAHAVIGAARVAKESKVVELAPDRRKRGG